MDMFDRFTDDVRRVLTVAQDEAHRLDHDYIGTEHLLLGLLRVEDSVAARVLDRLEVALPKVREAVEMIVGRGARGSVGEGGLTPRAKRTIELAIDEARQLEHRHIGTEHLLLGLVREGEGIAAQVFDSLGIRLDRVRAEVSHDLGEGGDEASPLTGRSLRMPGEERRRVQSGSPFESAMGFCRAIRVGPFVSVAGTAPIWPDGSVDPDPEVQARRCFEIIVAALHDLEAGPEHVTRTRMYITDVADSEAVGRAHAAAFAEDRPASTMVVVAGLLDPRWKVEIEVDALVL